MPSQFKLPWYKSLVKGDVEWMDGAISTVQDKKKQKNKIKKIEKIKTKQGSHGFKREKKNNDSLWGKKRSRNCFRSPTCIR